MCHKWTSIGPENGTKNQWSDQVANCLLQISQKNLDSFLAMAEELHLKGFDYKREEEVESVPSFKQAEFQHNT